MFYFCFYLLALISCLEFPNFQKTCVLIVVVIIVEFFAAIITVTDKFTGCKVSAEIAQLGERQTEDLKVPGSNPESSHEL